MYRKQFPHKVCCLVRQDTTLPPAVWLFRKISTLTVALTIRTAIKTNPQRTPVVYDAPLYSMFGCKLFRTSGDMEVIILSPHCDLDLEDGNPTFHMTFQVMLMHHHTKFHEERLSGSEDIRRNIPQGFEPSLWPWPWRQQSKIVNNIPAHDDAPLFHIWLQKVFKKIQ